MSISQKAHRRLRFWAVVFAALLVLIIAAISATNLLRARIVEKGFGPAGQVRILITAEITYATDSPNIGFTCHLTDLGKLLDAKLVAGQKSDYRFVLQHCRSDKPGGPNTQFQIVASPFSREAGSQVYCSDDSGVVRTDLTGSTTNCLDHGSLAE